MLHALDSEVGGWVEWYLTPTAGSMTGVPFRYSTPVTARGRLPHPDCYLFDAYYRFDAQEWLCSTLKLAENGSAVDDARKEGDQIEEAAARRIALDTLADFSQRMDAKHGEEKLRMRVMDVQRIDFLWPTDDAEPPESRPVWAVNFTSDLPTEADGFGYRFTIWVSNGGRTSDLKVLDLWPSGGSELSEGTEHYLFESKGCERASAIDSAP